MATTTLHENLCERFGITSAKEEERDVPKGLLTHAKQLFQVLPP
jgi:hypothetical protein